MLCFNMLQAYNFLVSRQTRKNRQAQLREESALSTTFSTEDGVSNPEKKSPGKTRKLVKTGVLHRFTPQLPRQKTKHAFRSLADREGAERGA
jgi:hypothetical protein